MKDELVKPRKSSKRRLTLGIDKVSNIIDQLDWSKLETCFGISFEFSAEMKFELAHELALQHGRLDEGLNGKLPYQLRRIKECAKSLKEQIEDIYIGGEEINIQSLSSALNINDTCSRTQFEVVINNLSNLKSKSNYCPPSDLYRDCMKAIASQLNKSGINLSLYKNSPFHKFILELDSQLPNTIFPATQANYADDSRFRIMRDYLRAWFRERS